MFDLAPSVSPYIPQKNIFRQKFSGQHPWRHFSEAIPRPTREIEFAGWGRYIPRDMEITLNIVGEIDPVAIYAALVATAILIWDVVKWLRSGPRVKVRANPNMEILNGSDPRRDGETYISVMVTNVGYSPTTITNLGLALFRNRWDQLRRKPDRQFFVTGPEAAQHLPLPHVLNVGEQWLGLIDQKPEFVQMAKNGLLYATVSQSVKRRPVSARIIIPDS